MTFVEVTGYNSVSFNKGVAITNPGGIGVVYFHGAASTHDFGPDEVIEAECGIRIFRHVRPGYDGTPHQPKASLCDVAGAALDEALAKGFASLVVMGWSGGGPYALAAGSLGRPEVVGVGLLSSWAPMNPPHVGLPGAVRFFMQIGQRFPRSVLRTTLAAVGRRNPGHVDDVRRIARPWGFNIAHAASRVATVAWHANLDPEVPIAPWNGHPDIRLHAIAGNAHQPTIETWTTALGWARSLESITRT